MTYMISSTYLNWLTALSYILALRCEYRKKLWVIKRLIVTLLAVY